MRQMPALLSLATALAMLAPQAATAGDGDAQGPSPAIMDYRRHMFDEPIRVLANRTMAQMFNTAPVLAAPGAAPLPGTSRPLDFTYTVDGTVHPASDVIAATHTDALLVIKHGRIVHESYYNRSDAQTQFNSYSMAKTINMLMIGLAIRQGKIGGVTDPVVRYVPELKGTGYDGPVLRDLLEMRSGVVWDENFFKPGTLGNIAHVSSWVEEKARYTDAARLAKPGEKPGTHFYYNSMDAGVLGLVVERATGMPVSRWLQQQLWQPAGMERDGFYVLDGKPGVGREFTAGGFNAVLRDFGRLGLFMLHQGRIGQAALLPEGFMAAAGKPTTAEADDGFGYGWQVWTVKGTSAYAALGGEDQYIYVDPATDTVIVKLSHGPVGPESEPVTRSALAFFRAASAWPGE